MVRTDGYGNKGAINDHARLRHLLSHFRRFIVHKITGSSKPGGLQTKIIEIIGYSTVIPCTIKF